jgi:serine protease Do
VLKIDAGHPLPYVNLGDSAKVRPGEWVVAMGNPFGLGGTVTMGIVSATGRSNLGIEAYEDFIQTDAPINPGNSGGPLVNMSGEVIGVNSAIVTGGRGNDGIGFAVPIDMAANVADQLIKDGKVHRARIGIKLGVLTPVLARQLGLEPGTKGILVDEVVPGSPAEKAGLKQGDVIVGFAGEKVTSRPTFRLKVASSPVGKSYEIDYFREGKRQSTTITPAPAENVVFDLERDTGQDRESKSAEPAKTAFNEFGFDVQPLTAELAKSLDLPAGIKGLLVSEVKEGSSADAEGIKQGDVITKVVRDRKIQPLTTVKEFQDLASKADAVSFYVQSGKNTGRFVTLSKAKK